ncbi:MAG: hypothetical protein IT546_01695 [Caulobacteraceae bacterium]|nr:hypothetical protein [Caulobacteraceae bacterium]
MPGLAFALSMALTANAQAQPAHRLITAAELKGPLLVEALAPIQGGLLVSAVHGRGIFELDRSGVPRRWLAADAALGVFGLAADPEHGVLWAVSAGAAQAVGVTEAERRVSELLKIDLASREVLARYPAPDPGAAPRLGDVAVGPDGTVYVSNPLGAAVYRLRPGDDALTVLASGAPLKSPQGLVLTPDGEALIVANYGAGLHRIDLSSGALTAVSGGALRGLDGLTRHGRSILAIRNGGKPAKVLRLVFDPGWTRVTKVEELASGGPDLDEPTTGIVREGLFVFISRSQWSAFEDDGDRKADVGPARISILQLEKEEGS